MRPITWLHISDIHLRTTQAWAQDIVLRAMCDDIARRHAPLPPDFVLISGDLGYSGKPTEYKLVATFLDALSHASRVPKPKRIFCVPGNHDIDRERQRMAFAGARATLHDQNRIDSFLEPSSREDLETLLQREEAYRSFQDSYFANQDRAVTADGLAYVSRLAIDDVQIAIVGLDSAWCSEGGISDHGKLLIGERQVLNAMALSQESATPPHVLLALIHHPTHVLQEFDRLAVQTHIERSCHFLHCGHLHDPNQRLAGGDRANGCLTLTSGASFETRHARNSYAIVTLDLHSAVRSVTTIHYNRNLTTFAEISEVQFPIDIQSSGVCGVGQLAHAISTFDAALNSWPHYLAALLLDRKSEIPVPTESGYAFASFAVIEAAPSSKLKDRSAGFQAFRNVLRVLYEHMPLSEIFRRHGLEVAEYGAALTELAEADATVKGRLDALEADAVDLAATEPRDSFSHTVAMLREIAETGDWDVLRTQAKRHIGSPLSEVRVASQRMLALALGNNAERAKMERAASLYEELCESEQSLHTDYGNLATLLVELGNIEQAQQIVLRGIATCEPFATRYLAQIGQTIVEETGNREYRTRLEAAIAEKMAS